MPWYVWPTGSDMDLRGTYWSMGATPVQPWPGVFLFFPRPCCLLCRLWYCLEPLWFTVNGDGLTWKSHGPRGLRDNIPFYPPMVPSDSACKGCQDFYPEGPLSSGPCEWVLPLWPCLYCPVWGGRFRGRLKKSLCCWT